MVVEYLLINGSFYCIQEAAKGLYNIRTLESFTYVTKGLERATKSTFSCNISMEVRELAKRICYLLSDSDLLTEERQEAERRHNMQKNRIYGASDHNYQNVLALNLPISELHQPSPQPPVQPLIQPSAIPVANPPAPIVDTDMREAEDYMQKRRARCKTEYNIA